MLSMQIFIVEDDALKAESVRSFLNELADDIEVRVYRSYQSGLLALQQQTPDLVVLDMTLPTYDRSPNQRVGRLRALGGYDLLRKLALKRQNTNSVVLTMLSVFGEDDEQVTFDDMAEKCINEFAGSYKGAIFFEIDDSGWRTELARVVQDIRGNP